LLIYLQQECLEKLNDSNTKYKNKEVWESVIVQYCLYIHVYVATVIL